MKSTGRKKCKKCHQFMVENNYIAADHGDQNIATVYHNPTAFLSIRVTLPILKMSNMWKCGNSSEVSGFSYTARRNFVSLTSEDSSVSYQTAQ